MKTKEIINKKLERNSAKYKGKYIFYKTNPSGISLIVLVITIIVIIILATAIILTLSKNNPIEEANRARYESDRDSMQAIFTNTVAKVMAKNQGSIDIKAGEINSIKSGVSSTIGEVMYDLENPQNSENKEGKIIFDNKENTQVEYYTGRKLPIYKAGETIWSVDSNGILKLSVEKQEYGNNGSSGDTTKPSEDKDNVVSKEEYESLKLRIEELERLKSKVEQLENNQNSYKTLIEQIQTNKSIDDVRAGEIAFGNINSNAGVTVKINFDKPMKDTNYSVAVTCSAGAKHFALTTFCVLRKTISGFEINAYNVASETTGNIIANYIVVPNI